MRPSLHVSLLPAAGLLLASAASAVQQPQVDAWGANSFRVRWPAPGFPLVESEYSPYVAQADANAKAPARARVFEKAPGVTASVNGNLEVDVDASTGLVSVVRVSDGKVLMTQTALNWSPASCYGAPCPNGGAGLPPSAELQFAGYSAGEVWVGAGEQGTRPRVTLEQNFGRDYADTEYYGYNSGRQAFLPLFFSSLGYGLMNAQPGYGHMQLQQASASASGAGPQSVFNASSIAVVDFWFTTTPGTPVLNASAPHPLLSLLDQYADAVGHAPLMPAFAAGFIASKDRYRNESQFLSVAHGYIDRDIPISMLTVERVHSRPPAPSTPFTLHPPPTHPHIAQPAHHTRPTRPPARRPTFAPANPRCIPSGPVHPSAAGFTGLLSATW